MDLSKYALHSKFFAHTRPQIDRIRSQDQLQVAVPVTESYVQLINRTEQLSITELVQAKVTVPKKKQTIPKKVKTDVWNTYIGADINAHRCLCCKKTRIQITDFQVGHVQSEKLGGTLEIGNLRPICASCNSSMGSRNMIDFVKEYGYYIG